MLPLGLRVRFYDRQDMVLALDAAKTALMLVDCDGESHSDVKTTGIASALAAARRIGLQVLYFHEDAYGIGGPSDITRELIGTRLGRELPTDASEPPQWRSRPTRYLPAIAPVPGEPDFPKDSQDGFATTNADYYLKTWGVTTLVAVGFALRSCLYHTCMGARRRNYRVIMLRDCTTPPGEGEFADTLDPSNPEGGWMRFAFIRQFETNIGYTATSDAFVRACE